MRQVSAAEANQCFARILSEVEDGEQIVVTKRGRPVAVISPYRNEITDERKAAAERLIAVMREPVAVRGEFRRFTRDEMHER